MGFNNLGGMANYVKSKYLSRRCAVPWADSDHVIEAVIMAQKDGIIDPILIGDAFAINDCIEKVHGNPKSMKIISSSTPAESAQKAVDLISSGQADILMKGRLETSVLMSAVLNCRTLRDDKKILSIMGVLEIPSYHKLLCQSDGGLVLYPDLNQKILITINAVDALRRMGIYHPKVAIVTAVETITSKMPETIEARTIKQMNERGEIDACIIEGPISYDLAISKESAGLKEFESPVAGDADLLIWPDITSGNIAVKALIFSGGAKSAGCVLGAKVPIAVSSRGSDAFEKYMALVVALATDRMQD